MTRDGGSVEDNVAARHIFLPVLRFVPVIIVPSVIDSLISFFCL
jgi:hypothetical protein